MHHGYYIPENRTDHQQAQIDLIDEVLDWAGAKDAKSVVDVGCGIGGSSRHIARRFGATAKGITLSPYQANRGNELAKEQGLEAKCSFQVADALDMPFDDNSFDLVWSLVRKKLMRSSHAITTSIPHPIVYFCRRAVSTCPTSKSLSMNSIA